MELLQNWFGTESITRNIDNELSIIESVLEDLSEIETIMGKLGYRSKKLKRVLAMEEKSLKRGLAIEQMIEKELQPYLEGKKKAKDLARILLLSKLLRDFREDGLWKDLLALWQQEQALIEEGNSEKVRKNLEEQKKIADILKKLLTLEYNETHMHFSMSADADIHWKYLKEFWKKAVEGRLKEGEKGIIKAYEEFAQKGEIFPEDLETLKRIMGNYMNGKWSEARAFVEFERLVFMLQESKGSFQGFRKKCNLLNAIDLGIPEEELSALSRRQHLTDTLESIVRHNLAHNVTHIEIRFPLQNKDNMIVFASMARDMEKKYNNRISIRFIEFMIGPNYDYNRFFEGYATLPRDIKKYIVAVDLIKQDKKSIELARRSKLPICIHAGEVFSQKDFPDKTKTQNVEMALRDVENALKLPNIYRIGHALVLGVDIKEYLKGSAEMDRLLMLQKRLIGIVRRRGIIIEANPTSNVMIQGMKTYSDHPISEFSRNEMKFAISTDDRTIFDTTLKKEFYRIARAMRWSQAEIDKAAKMQRESMLK